MIPCPRVKSIFASKPFYTLFHSTRASGVYVITSVLAPCFRKCRTAHRTVQNVCSPNTVKCSHSVHVAFHRAFQVGVGIPSFRTDVLKDVTTYYSAFIRLACFVVPARFS